MSSKYFEDTKAWIRTTNKLVVDFKEFALNKVKGGVHPQVNLTQFGPPDYHNRDHLGYCHFGLEFLAGKTYIAYIFIHIQPGKSHLDNSTKPFPFSFEAFSGEFVYGDFPLRVSQLQDCEVLIRSFNDSRFKLYRKEKSVVAFIAEIEGDRRTVVFQYDTNHLLDMLILY